MMHSVRNIYKVAASAEGVRLDIASYVLLRNIGP
jgi:hypothetical protein